MANDQLNSHFFAEIVTLHFILALFVLVYKLCSVAD